MIVLNQIANEIGTFTGVPERPAAGRVSYTVKASMPSREVTDPTNRIDLVISARVAGTWQQVSRWSDGNGGPWAGGPGKATPSLTYLFPRDAAGAVVQPSEVRGELVNGVKGAGSAAVAGLTSAFS